MPKAMEDALKREAAKKGYGKERTGAFVYGTLRKTGWKPSTQKKADGGPVKKARGWGLSRKTNNFKVY